MATCRACDPPAMPGGNKKRTGCMSGKVLNGVMYVLKPTGWSVGGALAQGPAPKSHGTWTI